MNLRLYHSQPYTPFTKPRRIVADHYVAILGRLKLSIEITTRAQVQRDVENKAYMALRDAAILNAGQWAVEDAMDEIYGNPDLADDESRALARAKLEELAAAPKAPE